MSGRSSKGRLLRSHTCWLNLKNTKHIEVGNFEEPNKCAAYAHLA